MTPYSPPQSPFLDIACVDDDFLIVNKPSGLLSVPGRGEEKRDSVQVRAQSQYSEATIVHRLDMETSGLMVLARNAEAHRHLSRQFETRQTGKRYECLVFGSLDSDEGEIDLPLRCDWPNRPKQMVDHELGKQALTHYQVLGREPGRTRVELTPVTGRSHQLRVHMLSLGHPILGDALYACAEALKATPRLCLHAKQLSFFHPSDGQSVSFETDVPF